MRLISDELKEKIRSGTVSFDLKIVFFNDDKKISKKEISGSDNLTEFEYCAASCEDQFGIGCFPAATVSFSIPLDEDNYKEWIEFKYSEITRVFVYVVCSSADDINFGENILLGKFYVDTHVVSGDILTIKCSDGAVKFDYKMYDSYFKKLKEKKKNGTKKISVSEFLYYTVIGDPTISIGYTIDGTTLRQIDELTTFEENGVEFENGITPGEISIDDALKFKGRTARQILMLFCGAYGCFCYMDSDGYLRFKQYDKENYVDELTEDDLISFESDGTVKITDVTETFTVPEEDMQTYIFLEGLGNAKEVTDESVQYRPGGFVSNLGPQAVIELQEDNKFIVSGPNRLGAVMTNQYHKFKGMTFSPSSLSLVPNPAYEIGDLLKITDHWGMERNVYATKIILRGNLEMEVSNAGNESFDFIDEKLKSELGTWTELVEIPLETNYNCASINNIQNRYANIFVLDNRIWLRGTNEQYFYDTETDTYLVDEEMNNSFQDCKKVFFCSNQSELYALVLNDTVNTVYKYEHDDWIPVIKTSENMNEVNGIMLICGEYMYLTTDSSTEFYSLYLGADDTDSRLSKKQIGFSLGVISSNNIVCYNNEIYGIASEIVRTIQSTSPPYLGRDVYASYIVRIDKDFNGYEKIYTLTEDSEENPVDGSDGILAVYKNRLHILGKETVYSSAVIDDRYHLIFDFNKKKLMKYSDAPYMCYGGALIECNGKLHMISGDYNNYHYVYEE